MATYDNVYTPSFSGRIGQGIAHTVAAFSAWNTSRATRKALRALTDRELDDIGLSRADVDVLS
ncbi:DUF1127 domain-containing protein [Shimia abyssi]|uniref:Uncharacterized protein DUF1127 n=1 Tax=Shimia abyssi TaxID=1662395 RepID=A0A2P8FE24_9RHOB|nr:DUF1127 domain-containing protein [Shimia abyssi]PSL19980.1 uncharacterized protein DUF1127 [Shimia abyssi]